MSKGPYTCKKYREEFQEAERNDDAFKCKRCDQHPDWHERDPAPGNLYKVSHPVNLIVLFPSHILHISFDDISLRMSFYFRKQNS